MYTGVLAACMPAPHASLIAMAVNYPDDDICLFCVGFVLIDLQNVQCAIIYNAPNLVTRNNNHFTWPMDAVIGTWSRHRRSSGGSFTKLGSPGTAGRSTHLCPLKDSQAHKPEAYTKSREI